MTCSIAARYSVAACPCTAGCSSAVQRRVPLRLEQVRHRATDRLVVLPLFTRGLHCGTRSRNPPCATAPVLPPFSGGLHCGCVVGANVSVTPSRVFPPFSGGLHCGTSSGGIHSIPVGLLPPSDGGLHCGNVLNQVLIADDRCFCRLTAGSIAVPGMTTCGSRC